MSEQAFKDQSDRNRIREDTSSTLFVNAGAGSGKTTALVDRVTTLVLNDDVPLRTIAAVTFTEKAGAELRDRLRERFEKTWRDAEGDDRSNAQQALDDLDGAAIGTLHAFAQRLLMEHPIEAKLPPLIEVLDEVGSSVAFEERWSETQSRLLEDKSVREPLLLGMTLGMKLDHVRSLSLALSRDWDLIGDRIISTSPQEIRVPDLSSFLDEATVLVALSTQCSNEEDRLLPRLRELEELVALLAAAATIEAELEVIGTIASIKFSQGQKGNWNCPIDDVRQTGKDLVARAVEIVAAVLDQCLRAITHWVAGEVLAAAESRRRDGRLEFHDLLVLARELLTEHEGARAALHNRYQRLLLDEFQDTDPIQIELAVRIAGGAAATEKRWQDVAIPEGRLFVVGDAKQSIYRFRRASIATYLEAQDNIGSTATLSTNFRTVSPILDWINEVFGELIQHEAGAQPTYDALDCARADTGGGPAVTVLGAAAHEDLPRAAASILRERESADVAAAIRQAIDEGWQVFDRNAKAWRPAQHHDIAVLVPARTSLPFLEDALDKRGVPYRAEASTLVYQASEVRDLLACARALADSTDALSLVTALRSPLFGCGDDDLWRWKQAGGKFSIYSQLDSSEPLAAGPVGNALTYLRHLSFETRWLNPSELLGRIVADRRMFEVAASGPRARDSWRRLRFVIDQARAWSEVSHGGLRGYLAWAAHQGQETSRVAEAVLPETDINAVRIMTVHAAKGLEFPIVILSGMTAQGSPGRGVKLLWPATGGYAVKLAKSVQTGDFDAAAPVDEQMDRLEKLRLLYVAATRTRDHLVVSLHRVDGGKSTAAKLIAEAHGTTAADPTHFVSIPSIGGEVGSAENADPPPAFETWISGVEVARATSRRIAAISASGLEGTEPTVTLAEVDEIEEGKAKGVRDLELPPWSKGRYGSAIGRAVHGVLQVVDLATGDGLEQAVTSQSVAEGIVGQEGLVRALVQSALDNDIVKRAAVREHWRETYVGTVQDDGTILEGYVDLIYREDDKSLVIVDYKTDAVPSGAIASRVTYYKPQMDAYVRCLSSAVGTGTSISSVLLFLHPAGSLAS